MTALITANANAVAGNTRVYTCDSSVQVGEFVCIDSAEVVKTVNVSLLSRYRAIGVCIEKISTNSCIVQSSGIVSVFSGLTAGEMYSIGLTGTPILGRVSGAGRHAVAAGIAISESEILLQTATIVRLA